MLGEDPPSGKINPEYKQQPSNPRKCIECGKTHDTIVEHMGTGERIEELEKCKGCLFKPYFNLVHVVDNYSNFNKSLKEMENELHEQMKKIYDEVEIDQKFDLEKLERPKTPEPMKKWLNDFLHANGVNDRES